MAEILMFKHIAEARDMISLAKLVQIGLSLCIASFIGSAVYNVLFHPLRKFPGPLSHGMFFFPRFIYQVRGRLPFHIHDLHQRYGPVVRIAPGQLSFTNPQAWRDIYGHKHAGEPEMTKDDATYRMFPHVPASVIDADRDQHSALRRRLAHGFSDRSMHEQEPIIGSYVSLLISRLQSAVKETSRQNIRDWYNWTTFDVIGDLSFGVEGGFGCLAKSENHPWVELIARTIKEDGIIRALYQLGLARPMTWLSKTGILAADQNRDIIYEKVGQRMESGDRPDFLQGLISRKDELGLNHNSLASNATLLVRAGSETTATLMSGVTYFLTTQPEVLKRVKDEVRSSFKRSDDITLSSVSGLSYMLACLNEGLRMYPPVMFGLPRVTPKGGAMVDGNYVPEETIITMWQWPINHSKDLWTEPDRFAPERWMGDPHFKNDRSDAMQPFGVGPRNCLGRNLAYAEMRLILAKLLFNFDISIDDDSRDWLAKQEAYEIWHKPALHVHLKPVTRGFE
ncbi:cytochrome P450 [Xylaria sp. CBS 124048]|nr:cytochrome P450 [Xylaria sp. CBS 124048]